jgi:hypothetical protein
MCSDVAVFLVTIVNFQEPRSVYMGLGRRSGEIERARGLERETQRRKKMARLQHRDSEDAA